MRAGSAPHGGALMRAVLPDGGAPMRAVLALLLFCTVVAPARAESLVVSLSFTRLAVTSSYTGASVAVFGAVERDGQAAARSGGYDVVVTIRGPRQALTVREKEALGPVWVNRAQQKFAEVPSFLAVLSSRPLPDIADEATRRRLRLGLSAIVAAPDLTLAAPVPDDPFREALLRLRRRERLFTETASGVRFLAPTVFRATAPLPATAPVGPTTSRWCCWPAACRSPGTRRGSTSSSRGRAGDRDIRPRLVAGLRACRRGAGAHLRLARQRDLPERLMPRTSSPAALILGAAGLIPFLGLSALVILGHSPSGWRRVRCSPPTAP